MKNIFRIFLLSLGVAFIMSGCDVVEPPYTENHAPIDPTDTVVRKIFLEDFTGHTCPNCPAAAVVAHALQEEYPGRIIVNAVHATLFAEPAGTNYMLDLRCNESTEIDDFFDVSLVGYPQGLINRKEFSGSKIVDFNDWSTIISELLSTKPDADININRTFNSGTSAINLSARVDFFSNFSNPIMIAAYLNEDSIVGYQKNNNATVGTTPDIIDYVFMHVMRGSMNGTWGDTLSASGATAGTQLVKSLNYTITNNTWNKEHMNIIVFIYDATTLEVIQTEEIKLK